MNKMLRTIPAALIATVVAISAVILVTSPVAFAQSGGQEPIPGTSIKKAGVDPDTSSSRKVGRPSVQGWPTCKNRRT